MRHIKRADHNQVIRGERVENGEVVLEGVGDLSARVGVDEGTGKPCITSHWQPDAEDIATIVAGGLIELDVLIPGGPPPVRVSAVPSLPDERPTGFDRDAYRERTNSLSQEELREALVREAELRYRATEESGVAG